MMAIHAYMNPKQFFGRSGRERRAFSSYEECARVWVRQVQNEGRAGKGRMFFESTTIYSYGYHFPLARIFHVRDVAYVLVNSDSHSVTTSHHQRVVREAINGFMGASHSVFYVDTRALKTSDRQAVYAYYAAGFRTAMQQADKPRIRHTTREQLKADCLHYANEANRFAKLHGDINPFPESAEDAFAIALHEDRKEAA